jgi:hypothetical protein
MPAKLPKKRRTRVTFTRTSEVLDVRMAAELIGFLNSISDPNSRASSLRIETS